MGGEVLMFGKPYENFYEIALKILKISDKSKILAIGDTIETDV